MVLPSDAAMRLRPAQGGECRSGGSFTRRAPHGGLPSRLVEGKSFRGSFFRDLASVQRRKTGLTKRLQCHPEKAKVASRIPGHIPAPALQTRFHVK
jgi:hypothetical protein